MTAHATLGASGAHRWMRCTGSPRLVARLTARGQIEPGQTSVYAEEGSAAHALGEGCIASGKPAAAYIGEPIAKMDGEWQIAPGAIDDTHMFVVSEEMAEAVQVYLDTIAAEKKRLPCANVLVEERVYPIAGAEEEMFGTADVILWDPVEAELVVMDYKHGAGVVVDANYNVQTMFYGLGALRAIAGDNAGDAVRSVRLVIVQPRARHVDGAVRFFEMSARDLVEWGGVLRSAAEATKQPDSPLAAGDWCKFCPAAALCPELRRLTVETVRLDFDEPVPEDPAERLKLMLPDPEDARQLGTALDFVDLLDMWCREVEGMALRRLEYGKPVAGRDGDYKLVRKRSTRRWTDPKNVEAALKKKRGVKSADIYERKLRSPAQLEKVKTIGKDWVKGYAEKPEGGLTVARGNDPRPAVPPPVLEAFDSPKLLPAEVPSEAPATTTTNDSWLEVL